MAYRTDQLHPSGKNVITFNPLRAMNSTQPFGIPCGRCTGCRLDKARQWSVRCMHEARYHEHNSFITLTYADEHLPADGGLSLSDWQGFMKRLRRRTEYHTGGRIRFFGCGEYGETTLRPHYHALLFGYDPPDKERIAVSAKGYPRYNSDLLTEIWGKGHTEVGSVTHESAGYVARYTMKKVNGDRAADHYLRPHPFTGKLHQVRPEFGVMSKKPGIGSQYVEEFKSDFYPSDFIIVDGRKTPVPRYYFNQLAPEEQLRVKRARTAKAVPYKPERTNARRFAKMTVRDARINPLKRNLG